MTLLSRSEIRAHSVSKGQFLCSSVTYLRDLGTCFSSSPLGIGAILWAVRSLLFLFTDLSSCVLWLPDHTLHWIPGRQFPAVTALSELFPNSAGSKVNNCLPQKNNPLLMKSTTVHGYPHISTQACQVASQPLIISPRGLDPWHSLSLPLCTIPPPPPLALC